MSTDREHRISEYLHSLEPEADPLFKELRQYAAENEVPIIRIETESFIRTVLEMLKPKRILEIGTAIGYSSICMAEASEAKILTIENYDKRIPIAKENIKRSGFSDRIRLIEGDAGDILRRLATDNESFDFIFLDAAKGQYPVWLPDIMSLMHTGSLLLADNVLQDGTVTESRFAIPRRERTTHERMRDFLYIIKHNENLRSSVLNVGDGVSLSVRL